MQVERRVLDGSNRGPASLAAVRRRSLTSLTNAPLQPFGMRAEEARAIGSTLESAGLHVARYALVLVLLWIGAMKFTAYEAGAIQPLGANSPLRFWLYAVFSVQPTSNLIGWPRSPRAR